MADKQISDASGENTKRIKINKNRKNLVKVGFGVVNLVAVV
ncbi:hypothetical protein [Staphylococcus saprophyticus]